MLNDEILVLLVKLFDEGHGPSHDELDRLFTRTGLAADDPRQSESTIGKGKRVRAVLGHAIDKEPAKGWEFVMLLMGAARGAGCFRPTSEHYAGAETVDALRVAVRRVGYDLDAEGTLLPAQLESLGGTYRLIGKMDSKAENRLRNAKGDGHGRPEPCTATELEARLCSQSAGMVSDLLLTMLEKR